MGTAGRSRDQAGLDEQGITDIFDERLIAADPLSNDVRHISG